ncbi:MAG: hypothetical protein HY327_01810 [Chloroflexi bacterium]|nr:hypothetical protein [Chloroflexota bacterium]
MSSRDLKILFAYFFLALVLTFPLALNFSDHIPGTTTWSMDEYGYVWNNWWFKHAVFDLGANPFQTNYLLYPVGASLVLYTFTLLHILLGLPIQFAFGLIPASNAELLFSFALNGYGAYLLARYLLRVGNARFAAPAAFIAGALFAFSSNHFVYAALGHYNVVGTEWIPFFILFLIKTVREPARKNALLAGLFAAFAMYVETTSGVWMLLFALIYLLSHWRATFHRAALARLALAGATAAILFAPLLLPTLDEILNSGYVLPGWGHAEKLLVDLFGFFVPTSLHPLVGGWTQELDRVRQGISRFVDVNTVFIGYVTLALALIAVRRYGRTVKLWAVCAIAFGILSLGPLLHINGQSQFDLDGLVASVPLPFLLLHYIPFLKENRVPNRFSILMMLSLAMLVAYGAAWLIEKIAAGRGNARGTNTRAQIVAGVLLIGVLFEHASVPLPLTDARVPDVFAQIAREPGDFAILTLPFGLRNSFGGIGAEDTRTQYYQSVHQKFIFPANLQRNPPFVFDYFDRLSLFHSLAEIELYRDVSDEIRAQDQRDAPALMAFFDVRYLVINAAPPNRVPFSDTRAATIEYARAVLPLGEKIYDRDDVIAYRVNPAPLLAKLQIDFGATTAQLYQGEGWDRAETLDDVRANWVNRKTARVFFPLREISDYALTLRALPFNFAGAAQQTMEIVANGQALGKFDLKASWSDYSVTLPARVLHSGLNEINLSFARLNRPRDVSPAQRAIGRTGATTPVDLQVRAGGVSIGQSERSRKRAANAWL